MRSDKIVRPERGEPRSEDLCRRRRTDIQREAMPVRHDQNREQAIQHQSPDYPVFCDASIHFKLASIVALER
jgi:hypothetical protein